MNTQPNAEQRRRKAPPIPKFQEKQQSNSKEQLQSKLNQFLTSLNKQSQKPPNPHQNLPPEKQKKKSTLANINSKLNSMLSSKKINLNKIQDNKNPIKNQTSKSLDFQGRNRREIDIQYDPFQPNCYDTCKYHYLSLFESLAQPTKKQQTIPPEEENKLEAFQESTNKEQLQQKQQIALRMMQKLGYKVGDGLGKNNQGIKTPLTIKKMTDSSCIVQPSMISLQSFVTPEISAKNILEAFHIKPTRVIVAVGLVKLQDLNDQVEKEIRQGFEAFGKIVNWIQYMLKDLRIFIQYENPQQAFKAFVKLNNMYYYENIISIRFYDEQAFRQSKLGLDLHDHLSF